jgi:WhiB family transcriptional regulator, redox-sensing transcriptional regulator
MADFSRLPGPNADLWDWQLRGLCRGKDSSLFFHPEGERGAARSAREASAKEVCMRCPVRAECATHALAVREPYGVWGGLTEDEREAMMGRSRTRVSSNPDGGSADDSSDDDDDVRPSRERARDDDHDRDREVSAAYDHDHDLDHDLDHDFDLDDDHDLSPSYDHEASPSHV